MPRDLIPTRSAGGAASAESRMWRTLSYDTAAIADVLCSDVLGLGKSRVRVTEGSGRNGVMAELFWFMESSKCGLNVPL